MRVHLPRERVADRGYRGRAGRRRTRTGPSSCSHGQDCEALLDEFCAETGLPDTRPSVHRAAPDQARRQAAAVDAKYPENTDLVIDPADRRAVAQTPPREQAGGRGALALEEALKERMPERTLLEILAQDRVLA